MITSKSINQELANKFYLYSIGMYAAITSVFGGLYVFHSVLGLNQLVSIFIAYFITVLWRSLYDQLTIYKLKIQQINLKNNLILALIGALTLAVLYYFIKPLLGDWSIPVTIIISMRIIGKIKTFLWPTNTNKLPELLKIYSKKLKAYIYGLYGFFIGVALITSQFMNFYGKSYFYFAFALGIFIGLLFEQLYEFITIYKIKLMKFNIFMSTTIAIFFAILCTTLAFILMQSIGFSGKVATISGVISLKLIQPLISNLLLNPCKKLNP